MAQCKTALTPSLTHWSYCSLALSNRYISITRPHVVNQLLDNKVRVWVCQNSHFTFPVRPCSIVDNLSNIMIYSFCNGRCSNPRVFAKYDTDKCSSAVTGLLAFPRSPLKNKTWCKYENDYLHSSVIRKDLNDLYINNLSKSALLL